MGEYDLTDNIDERHKREHRKSRLRETNVSKIVSKSVITWIVFIVFILLFMLENSVSYANIPADMELLQPTSEENI